MNDFREFWADVKTPGDGFAYSVGTIEVPTTLNAFFSGFPVFPATSLPFLQPLPGTPAAQVVILQQAQAAGSLVFPQRFLYGTTGEAAHARAVHVWPAAVLADARIAICGETLAQRLPFDNPDPWPGAGGTGSVGFIAMFDGNLNLLWSYRLFGTATDAHCAITDVSVRVEFDQNGVPTTDYVTFCGASTYGMPANNGTLTAVQPFVAPAGGPCGNPAGGDTDNGADQWDGIVGRLSHAHVNSGNPGANLPATIVFLSAVGGNMQDGLFGIVDLDEERFAVVGSTGSAAAPPPGADFPVTFGACPSTATAPFSAGVTAVFRGNAGALELEWSQSVGTLTPNTNTALRDVHFRREPNGANVADAFGLVVVGATDDPNLFQASSLAGFAVAPTPQAALAGGVDGFVLGGIFTPPSPVQPTPIAWLQGTYRGSLGNEGLTGVSGWNEFNEHFVVTGTTDSNDLDFGSYYVGDASTFVELAGGPIAGGPGGVRVGGAGYDRPTAVADPQNGPAMFNATTLGNFDNFGLGSPAGGGISVGPDARANVVGTTLSTNFPVVGAAARAKTGTTHDAVRVAVDMVPVGVGRTDGTGTPPPAGAPVYPLPGVFGGTTPECALTPFGHQIGLVNAQAAPALARMLIDSEGPAPAPNVDGAIVVSRPPNNGAVLGAALQFNFPGSNAAAPGPLPLLPDGVLLWTTDPSNMVFTLPLTGGFALRFPLNTLPAAGTTVSAQLVALLSTQVTGGAIGPVCPAGGTSAFAASPAIWLSW